MGNRASFIFLVASTVLFGCASDPALDGTIEDAPFQLDLPAGALSVPVPDGNELTVKRVELGKRLFHEKALSVDGTISCASCHLADHAFSDIAAVSEGVQGALGFRNSPTLGNVAYHPHLFRDGGVPSLELQVLAPIHSEEEMASNINVVAQQLRDVEPYRTLSHVAYGRVLDPYVITRSIACYERTLISGWSRYDRYVHQGDANALNAAELNGLALFNSTALGCTNCHTGFDLSDHSFQNIGTEMDYVTDPGRFRITLNEADRGRFKVPTLRNIALTAPYMHDGSMATLDEVIDHFASGGLPHPNRSPLMQPFVLTVQEKDDLIAFLMALTDERTLDQVP
jgi:cytochrome c peroxidase